MRPVGAELFHADGEKDGQADMTKLIVAFRNFANTPKSEEFSSCYALCNLYSLSISNDCTSLGRINWIIIIK
jgi:hypothetical protein